MSQFFKVDGKWLLLTSPYQTILMDAAGSLLADVEDDALEIQALLEPGDSKVRLRLRRSADRSRSIDITYDGTVLDVVGTQIPLGFGFDEPLKLHVFLDKSLLEIFVNGGCIAVTRVIDAPVEDLGVELIAQDASVSVIALEAWQVQTIW